jgi:K+-sensing histidine kinase KdpD
MPRSSAVPTQARPRSGARPRIRVLVVDDNLDHRTLIARRLRNAGMQVAVAASAEEALDAIEQPDGVDVVLLDYRLPGASGLEALETLRRGERPPSVVMVTGAGSVEVAVEAMRAGATNYVSKEHGYLEALPEVVERAWQHRDVAERAAELQRLALLVASATDREQAFNEIVAGAARLLRAQSCVLLVADGDRMRPVSVLGSEPDELDDVVALDVDSTRVENGVFLTSRRLVVPLPTEDGEALGVLAVWSDREAFTEEERELGRAFASFAGIGLRNLRQFELERRLVTEMQQTLDARRDFVASVSHELRTPLTAICGFTSTLQSHWERLSDERRGDLLERVGRNADDLRSLVDELLDLAQAERGRGQPRLERLDLHAAVENAIEHLGRILEGRDTRVEVRRHEVIADEALLRRTLGNLLSNAAKFSTPDTRIDVRAHVDGSKAVVEVVDRGIGLPEWEAARVFDPFFRASSSVANAVRGTGIGLALVREYVRTMGGEVGVRSTPGHGSTFSFTLPLADPGSEGA